jgi:hypothetical protein
MFCPLLQLEAFHFFPSSPLANFLFENFFKSLSYCNLHPNRKQKPQPATPTQLAEAFYYPKILQDLFVRDSRWEGSRHSRKLFASRTEFRRICVYFDDPWTSATHIRGSTPTKTILNDQHQFSLKERDLPSGTSYQSLFGLIYTSHSLQGYVLHGQRISSDIGYTQCWIESCILEPLFIKIYRWKKKRRLENTFYRSPQTVLECV